MNRRRDELDCAKGFAILMLILSHCIAGETPLKIWIFAWHMPIFFYISGVLQVGKKTEEITSRIYKIFKRLIWPYFTWGTILSVFYQILAIKSGEEMVFVHKMVDLITFRGIDSLWFIPVFISAQILLRCIIKMLWPIQMFSILTAFSLIYIYSHYNIIQFSPFVIKILIGFLFMYVGWISEENKLNQRLPFSLSIVLFVCGTVLGLYNGMVGIGSLTLKNEFLFFINGIILSFSILSVFRIFTANYIDTACVSAILRVFAFYGKQSIVILCTNNLIIEILRLLEYKVLGNIFLNNGVIGSLGLAVIVSIIEFILIKLLNGKLKFLIKWGKE